MAWQALVKRVVGVVLAVGVVAGAATAADNSIYQFHAKALNGKDIALNQYKGKVLLVVNTASECGYTPQYAALEKLYEKYNPQGLEILGFPCNQFGHQEPGDSAHIAQFCQKNYGVKFQMFSKIDVNGNNTHPIYQYLKAHAKDDSGAEQIGWNFTKFLINRNGEVVKRYASAVEPPSIGPEIEAQLAAK